MGKGGPKWWILTELTELTELRLQAGQLTELRFRLGSRLNYVQGSKGDGNPQFSLRLDPRVIFQL